MPHDFENFNEFDDNLESAVAQGYDRQHGRHPSGPQHHHGFDRRRCRPVCRCGRFGCRCEMRCGRRFW